MWLEIINSETPGYYLKYIATNGVYYFYLTNFVKIWESQLSDSELIAILRKNNPLIEADDEDLVKCSVDIICQRLLSKSVESKFQITSEGAIPIVLHLRILNDTFSLKLPLEFSSSNPETFCEQITLPLISKLKNLYASEECLMNILSKKDVEISEYRADGAELSLKHLKTQPFDRIKHNDNFKPPIDSVNVESINSIFNQLSDTFGMSCNNNLKEDSTSVDQKIVKKEPNPKLIKNIKVKSEPEIKIKSESPPKRSYPTMVNSNLNNKLNPKKKRLLNF